MMNHSDNARINQLTSPYDPFHPPRLPLDFGDYLSLMWRLDRSAAHENLVAYYRQCVMALTRAFDLENKGLGRMVRTAAPGTFCASLSNAPFRATSRLDDATARKAAIQQLVALRSDVLSIGAYQHDWVVGWPGSGIVNSELRERVFATLFTALRGQYAHFGRMLLVIDIVLQELLLGTRAVNEILLAKLVERFDYPDPQSQAVRDLYRGESVVW